MISYAIHPFNIVEEQPIIWNIIQYSSILFYLFSNASLFFLISQKLFSSKRKQQEFISPNTSALSLLIGLDDQKNNIIVPEKSLYQNILITGTIGTGKTSSAMYPFTKQLMEYKSNVAKEKLGMLILDVKGNYFLQVKKYAKEFQRENDLLV